MNGKKANVATFPLGFPLLVFGISLAFTAAVTGYLRRSIQRRDADRFENVVQASTDRVRSRLEAYTAIISGTAGFFTAHPDPTPDQFHVYTDELEVTSVYPGMQGLAFALRMAPAQGSPLGVEAERWVVTMIEPKDLRNRAVLGFDLHTHPVRRAALEQARDTGHAASSSRLTLLQEIDEKKQAGFLISVPVYRPGPPPQTVEARRGALVGFVSGAFRGEDLFRGIFGTERRPQVDFALYDGDSTEPDHLIHDSSHGVTRQEAPRFRAASRVSVAQHEWMLVFSSLPAFESASSTPLVPLVLLAGLLMSGFLFSFSRQQALGWQRAESLNQSLLRSEQALKEESRINAILLRIASTFASELDEAKLVQRITDEATALTGAQFGAFFHTSTDERGQPLPLDSLAGAPRESFAKFPMPCRLHDVTEDPRYGENLLHHGMPKGHLPPVRSYMAVPVISRRGTVLGDLFFGHGEPGRFTAAHETLMAGVAHQAAVALDNARLFKESQEAVRARDDFMSIASHELRTPLTPLTLQLNMLQRSLCADAANPQSPMLIKKVESASRQTQRLAVLVESLLDVSRINTGKLSLRTEPTNLAELVRDVVERFTRLFALSGTTVTLEAAADVMGTWDPIRLEQVVTNLLSNALKYGDGKPVQVRVMSTEQGAVVEVQDGGIGIGTADLERIFNRYERAVSASSYGGLGLGLFISRRIVEMHGGKIQVTSTAGAGSLFRVELPREISP